MIDSDLSGIPFSALKLEGTHLDSPYLFSSVGIRTFQRRSCCQGRRTALGQLCPPEGEDSSLKNGGLPRISGNSPDWTWARRETCPGLTNSPWRIVAWTSSWVRSGRAHGRTESPGQDSECGLCIGSTLSNYWTTWSPSWSQARLSHHSAR